MDNYLSQQRMHVFSNVGVLIYVFDIESRDVDVDMSTYLSVIAALIQYSANARVFILINKMDLIMVNQREMVFNDRVSLIRRKTNEFIDRQGLNVRRAGSSTSLGHGQVGPDESLRCRRHAIRDNEDEVLRLNGSGGGLSHGPGEDSRGTHAGDL